MGTKTPTKPVGLERSADQMSGPVRRARDKMPHDALHLLPSGFCGCLCPKCWRRLTVGAVCICLDCRCGGPPTWLATWAPAIGEQP
jgi:hypothetical protein